MTGISSRLDSLESGNAPHRSDDLPPARAGNDERLAQTLRAQVSSLTEDLRGKEERIRRMEDELERTRERERRLARDLASTFEGGQQALSSRSAAREHMEAGPGEREGGGNEATRTPGSIYTFNALYACYGVTGPSTALPCLSDPYRLELQEDWVLTRRHEQAVRS